MIKLGWIQAELDSDTHDDLRTMAKGSEKGIGEICADMIEDAVDEVDISEYEEEEEDEE